MNSSATFRHRSGNDQQKWFRSNPRRQAIKGGRRGRGWRQARCEFIGQRDIQRLGRKHSQRYPVPIQYLL
jgi:hypothetical protein